MESYKHFEPEIHDFGDNYHKSDEELFSSMDERIKNIKRKYRHYEDWLEAIKIVNDYMENLIEKYGGEFNFRTELSLGNVKEYIPFYPRYKETKRNKLYHKHNIILSPVNLSLQAEDDEICDPETEKRCLEAVKGERPLRIKFGNSKKLSSSLKGMKGKLFECNVAKELDLLESFYANQITSLKSSGKKNISKALSKRRKEIKNGRRGSITERCKEYNKRLYEGDRGPDPSSVVVVYKNTTLTLSQVNELKIHEAMKKAGFDMSGSKASSKKVQKMIKKDKKKEKAKKKSKKKKGVDKFIDELTDGQHKDFSSYEVAMKSLLGSALK